MRWRKTALLALLALATGIPAAHADDTDDARRQFEQGVAASRAGDWEQARMAFERAYRLAPRPVVILNLAGAQAKTGQVADAARNYRRYLGDPQADPKLARAAEEVLAQLEPRIPRVRFVLDGTRGDELYDLDGIALAAGALAQHIPMNAGSHALVIRRGNRELARVVIDAVEGQERAIPIHLPPEVEAADRHTLRLDPSARRAPEKEPPSKTIWASPWFWGAVGVVAAGVAVGFALYPREREPYIGNLPPGHVTVQ